MMKNMINAYNTLEVTSKHSADKNKGRRNNLHEDLPQCQTTIVRCGPR